LQNIKHSKMRCCPLLLVLALALFGALAYADHCHLVRFYHPEKEGRGVHPFTAEDAIYYAERHGIKISVARGTRVWLQHSERVRGVYQLVSDGRMDISPTSPTVARLIGVYGPDYELPTPQPGDVPNLAIGTHTIEVEPRRAIAAIELCYNSRYMQQRQEQVTHQDAVRAPNTCRDTAACCQVFAFESDTAWPGPVSTVQLGDYETLPWADLGIAIAVDQRVGTPSVTAPLGLFNVSKAGLGAMLGGASRLQQSASARDGMVLSAFNTSTTLLRGAQTLHVRLQKQAACVAHVRTLRSIDFSNREAVTLKLQRLTIPGDWSSSLVSILTTTTGWSSLDTRVDNDYEFQLTAIDELKVDFSGMGYGALASVEVCYSAPQGVDACGVCGGSATSCSDLPGAPCDTGMGVTPLSGDCSQGTVSPSLQCIPNRASNVELCNALDDNCNGLVDEGNWPVFACGVGACYRELEGCIQGRLINQADCQPYPPGAEVCDGIDNNCNGLIDEGGVCSSPSSTRAPTTASNTPSPSMAPSESATSQPSASPSPLPFGGEAAYVVPLLRCVRPTADGLYQAVFGYAIAGPQQQTWVPISQTSNWMSVSPSDAEMGQTQPTLFSAQASAYASIEVTFEPSDELHWMLRANLSDLGPRQTAIANRFSPQCNGAAVGVQLEPVEPLVDGCVVQRAGTSCTFSAGYYNPNPQTVQLPVGAGQNEVLVGAIGLYAPADKQRADWRQPRVFFPGAVRGVLQVPEFDCSKNMWFVEWALTTLNTTRRLRIDQTSVC
jgi:hypothetical protein